MFEMYLLETFNTFSDVSIADLVHEAAPQVSGHPPNGLITRPQSLSPRLVVNEGGAQRVGIT